MRQQLPQPPNIINLPGKKKKNENKKKETPTKKAMGKCFICGLIWKSKEDKEFRK